MPVYRIVIPQIKFYVNIREKHGPSPRMVGAGTAKNCIGDFIKKTWILTRYWKGPKPVRYALLSRRFRLVRQLPQLTSLESFAVHGSCLRCWQTLRGLRPAVLAFDAGQRCAGRDLCIVEHRASSIEHRASSIEHRASDPSAWGLPSIRLNGERGPRRGKFN